MDAFAAAFDILIGHEGGYGAVPSDPGNWTGGRVGAGVLRGTKYGISAASFPTLDIPNLSLDQAREIYRGIYWVRSHADLLPPQLGLLVFDAAVNNGVGAAVRFLQAAVQAAPDGQWGTGSAAALARALGNGSPDRVDAVCAEFQARRLLMMASLATWGTFGGGWARRLCRLPFQAARLAATAAS